MPEQTAPDKQLNQPPISIAEYQRQADELIQRALAEQRSQVEKEIPLEARLWMALAPGWTADLAVQCEFPALEPDNPSRIFERMVELGLAERFASKPAGEPNAAGTAYYVLTPANRAVTLDEIIKSRGSRSEMDQQREASLLRRLTKQRTPDPRDTSGAVTLIQILAEIGPRIYIAGASLPNLPIELLRWARLADKLSLDLKTILSSDPNRELACSQELDAQVRVEFEAAIHDPQVAQHVGAIQEWIEAARPLAVLLEYAGSPQLSRSISKAGRQIELLQRRQYEVRHLESFYRRPQQIQVIKDFLEGTADLWALHLIGAGGVGKTMLIRFLTCTLNVFPGETCQDDDLRGKAETITARIDFDYLNPQYPRQDPGLLLWSLGQELRFVDIHTQATPYFDRADRKFTQLRQVLQTGRDPNLPSLKWSTSHPLFREGVELFLEGLRMLNRPVILILDTCEELEKFSPQSDPQQNVEETFRILRALHDGVHVLTDEPSTSSQLTKGFPGLRVILSGRRLLASRGALQNGAFDWECLDSQDAARPEHLLAERPYLRLYELHGFSHTEAGDYLGGQGVPEELVPAVIQASSPDVASEIHIQYNDQRWLSPTEESRCNPFKLHLFMDWAKETENPPKAEDLLNAASGRYVELRIISRLRDEALRQALPLVALLGHFDKKLLAMAAGIDDQEAEEIYNLLLRQEWTTQHRAPNIGDEPRFILDVQRSIRDSLYSYYAARQELPERERKKAAQIIRDFLASASPSEVDWTDYDAALRVLDADLEEAGAWWDQVEERLLAAPDAQASLHLLNLLTGGDGSATRRGDDAPPETPPENRLRPYLLATQASLLFKMGQLAQLQKIWGEVAKITRREPESPAYQRLHRRALAGLVSERGASGANSEPVVVKEFLAALSPATASVTAMATGPVFDIEEAGGWIGAVEAILETAENQAAVDLNPLEILGPSPQSWFGNNPQVLADFLFDALVSRKDYAASVRPAASPQIGLAAYACALAGRAAMLAGKLPEAKANFEKALELVAWLESNPDPVFLPPVRDWLPPDHLPSRIRLVFIQAAYPAWLSAAESLALLPPSQMPQLNSVDGERLLAARLRLELAAGVPKPVAEEVSSSPFQPGVCTAHRRELPYRLRQAEILAAQGNAPAVLKFFLAEVSAASQNLVALAQIQRAFLPFLVRFRLADEGLQPQLNLPSVPDYDRYLYTRLYSALNSPEPPDRELAPIDVLFTMESLAEFQAVHLMWVGIAAAPPANQELISYAANSILPALLKIAPLSEPGLSFFEASLKLDFIEAVALSSAKAFNPDPALIEQLTRLDPIAWSESHPYEPEAALRLLLRCLALAGSTTVDSTVARMVSWPRPDLESAIRDLARHLGLRRAGEIACQEGQLLGLRLPAEAMLLLDWAAARFSEAGSFCDAWQASLQHALLFLRTQPRRPVAGVGQSNLQGGDGLELSLKRTETCYRQIPVRALPWEELADPARHEMPSWLDSLPVGLRPLLLRQVLSLDGAKGLSQKQFSGWLALHYRQTAAHGAYYPLEWRGWFEPGQPAAQEKESQGCSGLLKEYWKLLTGASTILIGIFCAWYFLFRYLVDRFIGPFLVHNTNFQAAQSYSSLNIWAQFGIAFLALLGVIGLVFLLSRLFPGIGRTWQGYWLQKGNLQTGISPVSDPTAPPPAPGASEIEQTRAVRIILTPHIPRLDLTTWRLYRISPRQPVECIIDANALEHPAQTAARLSEPFLSELKRIHTLLGKRRKVRVDLNIDPALALIEWEAVMALAVNPSASGEIGFNLQRSLAGESKQDFPARIAPPPGENLEIVVFTSSTRAGEAARQGWSSLAETSGIHWKLYTPGAPVASARIIHMWGAVEDTFGNRLFSERPEEFYGTQLESPQAEGGWSVDVKDFYHRYPNLALCILQGSITALSPERQVTEQREAVLLRQFAADLQALGIMVIVLPPHEPDQSAASLIELAKVFPAVARGDPSAFHPAIHAIRVQILARAVDREAGLERAMDVTVYLP